MIYVNTSIPQVFDSLVLYYNAVENKFYLLDGYPPEISKFTQTPETNDPHPTGTNPLEDLRNENKEKIAPAWDTFVNQLKKDGKYSS